MRTRQAIVLETYRRDKGTTSGQLWFRLIYFVLHNPLQCLFFFYLSFCFLAQRAEILVGVFDRLFDLP